MLQDSETEILEVITSSLTDQPGTYALYIKDLKSNQPFQYNSEKTFGSASIYKLAVMYKTYDEIAKGNWNKDDNLVGSKTNLDKRISGINNQETEDALNEPLESPQNISLDVETALYDMITISDNYAALLLADKLGWKNIDEFLKKQNIENFDVLSENPQITAKAVGQLLEQIYRSEAVNSKYSQEMLNLLLDQKINDRIPKYLPENVKVAHKTGELETIRNDAGIVFGKNSDYIFVFLSSTPDQDESTEKIAQLSKQLFNALENSNSLN